MATTFNPSDKGTTTVIYNSNMSIRGDNAGTTYEICRVVHPITDELTYVEFGINDSTGFDAMGFGICESTAPLNDWLGATGAGSGAHGYGYYPDTGNVYADGGPHTTGLGATTPGNRVCFCYKLSTNEGWWRVNNGNWNGSGTANPATGVGGITLTDLSGTLYVAAGVSHNEDDCTIYTSAASWSYAAPSGAVEINNETIVAVDAGSYSVAGRAVNLQTSKPGKGLYRHGGTPGFRLGSVSGFGPSVMRTPHHFYAVRVGDAGGALERQEFFGTAGTTAYTLTVAAGSYALSGQAVNTLYGRRLAVDAGAYTLTGIDVLTRRGYPLTVDAGAYTLAGQDVALYYGRRVTAEVGTYTLTGVAVDLRKTSILAAELGTYTLSGVAVGLYYGRRLDIEAGAYTLDGQAVALTYTPLGAYVLAVAPTAYSLDGQGVDLRATRLLAAEAGAYSLTGNDVGLTYTPIEAPVVQLPGGNGGGKLSRRLKKVRRRLVTEEKKTEVEVATAEPVEINPEDIRALGESFGFSLSHPAAELIAMERLPPSPQLLAHMRAAAALEGTGQTLMSDWLRQKREQRAAENLARVREMQADYERQRIEEQRRRERDDEDLAVLLMLL